MPRDILYLPVNETTSLAIATDCSASIGTLALDDIAAPFELTSYYLARVPLMELLSINAKLVSYTITTSSNENWDRINLGIQKALMELEIYSLPHIGSSESNFPAKQTSMGITLIGTAKEKKEKEYDNYAVIGLPLVGSELLNNEHKAVPLQEVLKLRKNPNVGEMIPVGSKGIKWEFEQYFKKDIKRCTLDIKKSAGPSTCIIINYDSSIEAYLESQYKDIFHNIEV